MIMYLIIGVSYTALVYVLNYEMLLREDKGTIHNILTLILLTFVLIVLWPVHLLKVLIC